MKKYIAVALMLAFAAPYSAGAIYLEGETTIGGDAEVSITSTGNAGAGVSGNADATVEVPVLLNVETETGADVSAQSELEASMASEGQIAVETQADGDVEIKSTHKGKFLGFLPVTFTAKTVVEKQSDGTLAARVEMPWWGFLIDGVARVKSNIEAILSTKVSADANFASQAELGSSIRSSLESAVNAEVGN